MENASVMSVEIITMWSAVQQLAKLAATTATLPPMPMLATIETPSQQPVSIHQLLTARLPISMETTIKLSIIMVPASRAVEADITPFPVS